MKALLLFLLILGALSNIVTLTANEDIINEIAPRDIWMETTYKIWLLLQIIAIILVFIKL